MYKFLEMLLNYNFFKTAQKTTTRGIQSKKIALFGSFAKDEATKREVLNDSFYTRIWQQWRGF